MDSKLSDGSHLMDVLQLLATGGDLSVIAIAVILSAQHTELKGIKRRLVKIEEKIWPVH